MRFPLKINVIVIPLVILLMAGTIFLAVRLNPPWWGQLLLWVPINLAAPSVVFFSFRRIMAKQIADTYLDAGLCASCGYDLIGIPPEEDGCRRCPECGAAWRKSLHEIPRDSI